MASEDPDRIVARIRRDVTVLADQLESLTADLRLLSELLSSRQVVGDPAAPDPEEPAAEPLDQPPAVSADEGHDVLADEPAAAAPGEPPDVTAGVNAGTRRTRQADGQHLGRPSGALARRLPWILAVGGSAVTLVGIATVLLPAGGPVSGALARTTIALVLAALAVVAAFWQHRRAPDTVGAHALLATGLVSALLCVFALTVRFVDDTGRPVVGLGPGVVLAAAVAVGGLVVARAWRSQGVAIVAVLAGLLFGPAVRAGQADGALAVVASMVLLTLAAGVAQRGLDWGWLTAARTAPTVLHTSWVAASPSVFRWGLGLSLEASMGLAATLAGVLALGGLALARWHRSDAWQQRAVEAAALVGLAAPLLVIAQTQEYRVPGAVACLLVGALFLASTWWDVPRAGSVEVRVVAAVLGVVVVVLGAMVALDRPFLGYLPWALAAPLLVLAERCRATPVLVAGSVLAVVGAVWWMPVLPVLLGPAFVEAVADQGVERVVQSLLGVAVAVLAHRVGRTFLPSRRTQVLHLAWSAAVVSGAVAVVLAGSLLGAAAGEPARGFWVAQVVVTIALVVLCLLLVSPRRLLGAERRARGGLAIGLAVAAVAKLFLVDTQALPVAWRAAAFLAVGVLMLGGGTWYVRQLDRHRRGPAGPEPGGTARVTGEPPAG